MDANEREIVDLKLQKARGKTAFTKTENKLIQSIDLEDGLIDEKLDYYRTDLMRP